MVLHHGENGEVLNRNHLILFGISFGRFIVKITALPLDLEMRLCCTFRGFSTAGAVLLARCLGGLVEAEGVLRVELESGGVQPVTLPGPPGKLLNNMQDKVR